MNQILFAFKVASRKIALMKRKKTILIAPLDWGLGHASRCIPIIREIIAQGHEIVIATDGRALELLKAEFPQVKCIKLQGYNPVYPKNEKMVVKMALQTPKFLFAIAREHFLMKKIISEHSIDLVISDNRYGLWSNEKTSVLLTHQLFIQMPSAMKWMESYVNRLNHFFIKKFHHCWVPDLQGGENLSGNLAHGANIPSNVEYIGTLSRFSIVPSEKKYDLLVLLSGPEPQRTILEEKIINQVKQMPLHSLIIRGVTEEIKRTQLTEMIEIVSHLTSEKMNEALLQADAVICRSGYSSVMELASLGKSAILIPTPGQTEQEYLAEKLSEQGLFVLQKQDSLNLQESLLKLKRLKSLKIPYEGNLLKETLKFFLEEVG